MQARNPKRDAAERAVERVSSGMVLGLGTGSTAVYAVEAIGNRLSRGELSDIVGVPTSRETETLAARLGIPLTTLDVHPVIDLTIDGADEVDPSGNLIKGGGGALLWEKIVAVATRRYVIVVDESKLVERLGQRFALPVEVMPFGWRTHLDAIRALGAEPKRREDAAGVPFATDGGHFIIDCRFPLGIPDPHEADRVLHARPGVVETGLFLDMRPEVIVGRAGGS
ncbi:MAG: ribose 5-phosphate isomerase A [Gemmatimonadales bacterium]|nr:ribose 5-phosphate isomerase A [Gemmatimonadales bacterium]